MGNNLHFFITGHTGFKGSWLSLLLTELGHKVSGYALAPPAGGLFQKAQLQNRYELHEIGDVRNFDKLRKSIEVCNPDYAIHFAAQPLVIQSYRNPVETFTINVNGTLNFLRSLENASNLKSALVITTDKVYRDDGKEIYLETDPLGGHDPYSSSKAMADLLTQSWSANHPRRKIHIARAGNVIGSFDVSKDRLFPDIVKAIQDKDAIKIRNPNSIRPWQHVLDCLAGYLQLLRHATDERDLPIAFNFGPPANSLKTVRDVLEIVRLDFPALNYEISDSSVEFKETKTLGLDSTLAGSLLGWKNTLDLSESIKMSLAEIDSKSALEIASKQIAHFLDLNSHLKLA